MTRRERLEARLERRREWAEKRDAKSAAGFERAHRIADSIPMGQPILIGHHSEKHHRADIARIDSGMRQGVESEKMASHHRACADGIERALDNSIFSDDADAVEALRKRIAEREAEREHMKAVNVAFRKASGDKAQKLAAILAAGVVTQEEALRIARNFAFGAYWSRQPYMPYELTNLGARIRADEKRISAIEYQTKKLAQAEADPRGFTIVYSSGREYCSITFPDFPGREAVNELKAAGFYWSRPSWQGSTKNLPQKYQEAPAK